MINKDNGFDLNIRWRFPGGREYAFAFITLFVLLIVIYANSFQGAWHFDDKYNIVENKNIFLKTLDWPDIEKAFYSPAGNNTSRPLSYFSFALNYYFDGLNVFGYHIVNFIVHYLSSVFLFLFIYNTLKLPTIRQRYGPASYSISLLATCLWATSPVQVTAVTYIVQRMASMAGMFYIMAMYFYLKGRTTDRPWGKAMLGGFCVLSAVFSFGTKENALLLPISIWLYDLLLIQGATRENIKKNLKPVALVILALLAIGLWYVDISSIFSGAAYEQRPFTLVERLLTQPRVIIFYITLLLYPISSRLTLIHDIEISTSILTPWTTLPAIIVIIVLVAFAGYICRKRPLISFSIIFFFLNHVIEGSFIPLELIYEHRNYIPSMFYFVPVVIVMLHVIDFFSYKKAIQFIMVAVFTFLLFAQGHTVFARNTLFTHPILLWEDNVKKTPNLSRPYDNLGSDYGNLGFHDKAYALYSKALSLNRYTNRLNRAINLYNLGLYHLHVTGEYDRALGHFQSSLEIYPNYAPAYSGAALCFIGKGDLTEAESRLLAALSIWPDNADLHHALSFILLKTGKYDQSTKEARYALLLNPDLSGALFVLGEALRRKGNDRAAAFYWERYIEKKPNDLRGNLALIELYAKQNKKSRLSQTIGKLMVLKGSKSWHELINQLVRDTKLMGYIPNPEVLIPIIRNNLDDQLS